jgi:putative transposase
MLFVLVFQRVNHDEGEIQIVLSALISIKQHVSLSFHVLQERFSRGIRPPTTSLLFGTLVDLTRGKSELLAENALLRHQLIILRRQIKRPVYRQSDLYWLLRISVLKQSSKQHNSLFRLGLSRLIVSFF